MTGDPGVRPGEPVDDIAASWRNVRCDNVPMCGIAGMLHHDGRPVDRAALQRMGDAIAHRGPDGEGFHVDDGRPAVGLVSRRLAVIDIEGGAQPMTTDDGAFTIVYNGEVFNAGDLRRELEAAGHRFRTRCDTEVVLRGYETWGPGVVERLNGMWALAIWDGPARRLFLARDRLGVKPLVYAQTPYGLVFASEIKALLAGGYVERALDPAALPHYLSSFAVPEPYSLVAGVRRLRAGHVLLADSGGVQEREYWDCATEEEDDRGRETYVEEVEALLADAVGRRMVSDVPIGVLLSGGVDSRTVAALAASEVGSRLRTFTLGFDVAGADERAAARAAAAALGAEHHEHVLDAREAAAELPDLLAAYDEPGQSLVQNHVISRFARRHVTVAVSGVGGDELFASYPTHVVVNMLGRFDALPRPLRASVLTAAGRAPARRLRRFAELAAMAPDDRATRELMHQTAAGLRGSLLAADVRASVDLDGPVRHLEEHYARSRANDPLNALLYVYVKTYLVDELLRALDAMSMWSSLEVRTPFLDFRLVELAMRMPAHHKMRLREGKLVLRDVASRTLGERLDRRKRGFSPPVRQWVTDALGEQVRDALSHHTVSARGVFDPATAQRVLAGALRGDARMLQPAMMLYAFETWAQRCLDAPPGPRPGAERRPVELDRRTRAPELSVIIVNWNTSALLRNCLASLAGHLAPVDHEVIVVDNASADGSPDMVEAEFPQVRLVRNAQNVGFGTANNQGMWLARGDWLLLLNSDTELVDGSVADLLRRVREEAGVAVAHCRLVFPDGRLQHTTYRLPTLRGAVLENLGLYKLLGARRAGAALLGGYWDQDEERDVDAVAGAFMLLPRRIFEQTGGFDERLFLYGEDLEWCRRIGQQGGRIRFYPQATVVHHEHASTDMRMGDDRIALCLLRERDLYVQRSGRLMGTAFVLTKIVGGVLRVAYYRGRGAVGGAGAQGYRDMAPQLASTLRVLLRLAVGRK
ncbi:MAG TPA: asparagine synthase (glutamine-hydrolyzing) [Solirubrobacteraceae bacterium]|nr:asparagine synthase (glutamine-hydrolyzing) [Solirubrobacteraceae bacterium]